MQLIDQFPTISITFYSVKGGSGVHVLLTKYVNGQETDQHLLNENDIPDIIEAMSCNTGVRASI